MGLFNNIKDHFKNAEFSVAPNKKLKTISREFKTAFNLSLVFYKGSMIAEETLTLAALNKKTTKNISTTSKQDLKIKASMKAGAVEDLFEKTFGVKVQIKDKTGKHLINNDLTLGNAARQ
ncbi:hypothetical protein ACFSQP_09330 [Bizionia sediminis]|uniref:Uncharacterized protein n=1 Tax=Bizionia sediminis TaxID=1737064 RepID=A0ABW5KSN4_9FLAO